MAAEVQCAGAYRDVTRLDVNQTVLEQAHALVYENDVSSTLDFFKSFSIIIQVRITAISATIMNK